MSELTLIVFLRVAAFEFEAHKLSFPDLESCLLVQESFTKKVRVRKPKWIYRRGANHANPSFFACHETPKN